MPKEKLYEYYLEHLRVVVSIVANGGKTEIGSTTRSSTAAAGRKRNPSKIVRCVPTFVSFSSIRINSIKHSCSELLILLPAPQIWNLEM